MMIPATSAWRTRACIPLACFAALWAPCMPVLAQVTVPHPVELEQPVTAIRCEMHTFRSPDAIQLLYFYLSDTRRNVFEPDGNPLGNVVEFSKQRIVVTKAHPEGGMRIYVFDRMLGALTLTAPATGGPRETWTLSGECQRVDASRQKF